MRAEELTELLRKRPFAPLRIHMTDGRNYDIFHPDLVLVLPQRVDIGLQQDPATGVLDRVDHCSLLHIVRVEELPRTTPQDCAPPQAGAGLEASSRKIMKYFRRRHLWASWPVTFRVTLVPFGAVFAGHLVGAGPLGFHGCLYILSLSSIVAVVLLAVGAYKGGRINEVSFAIYTGGLVLLNPICFIDNQNDGFWAIAYLLPVILGLVIYLRRGAWLLASGAGLVLFAGTAALTFNVRHVGTGIGFYNGWMY